jgi:hypothetical protein
MLQAKTKEQQDFVASKLLAHNYEFFEDITGCGITIYMDDDYYSIDLYFDDMAEIVDYLREQNNK